MSNVRVSALHQTDSIYQRFSSSTSVEKPITTARGLTIARNGMQGKRDYMVANYKVGVK